MKPTKKLGSLCTLILATMAVLVSPATATPDRSGAPAPDSTEAVSAPTPAEDVAALAGPFYIRTGVLPHRCLNVRGGNPANLADIILYNCVASSANLWYLDGPYGDGYYYIRSAISPHRCLNVRGGNPANFASIILYDCVASWNNVWYFQDSGTGNYLFIRTGLSPHRCLNVRGGNPANFADIILYDCVSSPANHWYLA